MVALFACRACRRHVRSLETSCPFCGAAREATSPAPIEGPRLSRSAGVLVRMLLGAGTTSAIACATATPGPEIVAAPEKKPALSAVASVTASASASASAPPTPQEYHSIPIYGSTIVMITARIDFDFKSSTVPKSADESIKAVAEIFAKQPDWYLVIDARAETAEGKDAAAREALSKKRGEAIAAKLVAVGMDSNHIRIEPVGASKPISEGKTKEDHAANRSSSFRIEYEDGSPIN